MQQFREVSRTRTIYSTETHTSDFIHQDNRTMVTDDRRQENRVRTDVRTAERWSLRTHVRTTGRGQTAGQTDDGQQGDGH